MQRQMPISIHLSRKKGEYGGMARLILPRARLSFSKYLFIAGSDFEKQEPRFSCQLLIPKGGEDEKKVKEAIMATAAEKWKEKAGGILAGIEKQNKTFVHDGDDKAAKYEGYDGCVYLTVSRPSKKMPKTVVVDGVSTVIQMEMNAPRIVDKEKGADGKFVELTPDKGKPYAGCYVRAIIDLWAQDNTWGKRINATLVGVQFVDDGDAFSATTTASDEEFADLADTGEKSEFDGFC